MKILFSILFGYVLALQASAQTASVSGDYVEARSGEVYTCGCLYSGEMVTAGKEAILAWRITDGDYQGIPLAGIKVAAVVVGENHLGLPDTPRRSVLYLDGITSAAQREAMLGLWSRQYAAALGRIEATHAVSITFEEDGDVLSVHIPEIAQIRARQARLPEDAHPGSLLWYQPFAPLQQSSLITIDDYEYTGQDFHRQWQDWMPSISGYKGKFTLHSSQ